MHKRGMPWIVNAHNDAQGNAKIPLDYTHTLNGVPLVKSSAWPFYEGRMQQIMIPHSNVGQSFNVVWPRKATHVHRG